MKWLRLNSATAEEPLNTQEGPKEPIHYVDAYRALITEVLHEFKTRSNYLLCSLNSKATHRD